MAMFRIHHGLQGMTDAQDVQDVLDRVSMMLEVGATNILITRPNIELTGETVYPPDPVTTECQIGTLVLKIPILS